MKHLYPLYIATSAFTFIVASQTAAWAVEPESPSYTNHEAKWRVSFAAAFSAADIRVVDSEVEVPPDTVLTNLTIETSDELRIDARSVTATIGYRILPFLEVAGRAGLIKSEINTAIRVTGDLEGPLGLFAGPIDFQTGAEREIDGYTLGLGAVGGLPIATIRSRGLAFLSGLHVNWNSLSNSGVFSTSTRALVGLSYPADRRSSETISYTVGASYNGLERKVSQSALINGSELAVQLQQEFVEPWSLDVAIRIPMRERVYFGVGASHSMSGATSAFLTITVQPGRGSVQ